MFLTLLKKEIMRFTKVTTQTIVAPVVASFLYLVIFGQALSGYMPNVSGNYSNFLVPGLVMMSILQNAFANSASSLIQAKINGSIIFILLSPITHWQFYFAYMFASVVRGLLVGLSILFVSLFFVDTCFFNMLWIIVFAVIGGAMLGTIGIIAGICSDKYDQLASFQNFLILPATFLSGVFYSLRSLPSFWQSLSQFNPFFYLVDGFRYGFLGYSDFKPFYSLVIVSLFLLFLSVMTVFLIRKGYKLRS